MARTKTSSLSNKSKRLALPIKTDPEFESLSGGASLGYRRNSSAGTWVARRYVDKRRKTKQLGVADDYQDADGEAVLSYQQAYALALAFDPARDQRQEEARTAADSGRVTVSQAIDWYEQDLTVRGDDPLNATRLRRHITPEFGAKDVRRLTKADVRGWRDGLLVAKEPEGVKKAKRASSPATVDRLSNGMRAAFNLAADKAEDSDSVPRESWEWGLKTLGNTQVANNVILAKDHVVAIVAGSYEENLPFGLLIEVAAVTGTRYSQIVRLRVKDLIGGVHDPKLLMPRSNKGKGKKSLPPIPIPITTTLAAKLREEAMGRDDDEPLLLKQVQPENSRKKIEDFIPEREAWSASDQFRSFRRVIAAAFGKAGKVGRYPIEEVTMYALRHTSIVRQLVANVPIRVVAAQHDTSVAMIEKHYSAYIADHADSLVRGTLQIF